jgi:hypothetical protein
MNALNKWAKRSVWLVLAAVLTIGCNPLQTVAFFLHKDDKLPAQYPLRPKEGPKKERDEEITILVLCDRGPGVPQEFASVPNDVMAAVAKRLPEMGKENKEKYAVVPVEQVNKFKMNNPNWKTLPAAQIGKKLGADYVIDLTIANVNIYQPGSGRAIYEGRCELEAAVYDTAATGPTPKDTYTHPFVYPKTGMIAADNLPLSRFKQGFVEQLAQEIVQFHLEHRPSDGIAAGR